MRSILESGLVLQRRTNKQGTFFEKITRQTILEALQERAIVLTERDIAIPRAITTAGEHSVELVLTDRAVPFVLTVEQKP